MRVLVVGATGCIGRAVVHALRSRGQTVIAASRSDASMPIDFAQPVTPESWAARLTGARIDAVINCVGILMPGRSQSFERVHAQGPIELFRGAALAGVSRIVQVSALGVTEGGDDHPPYITSKREADRALAALSLTHAIVRPSLVYGPGSASASLFATLASLPVISLPGGGMQAVQPIHVYEVAESIARWIENKQSTSGVFELAGPSAISYRDMLTAYRNAMSLGAALWLPLPMALMQLSARLAELLPQTVFSRDTLRLLERGNTSRANAALALLKRAPSPIAVGLRVTPPSPAIDLRVVLSPAVSWLLRTSIAALWLVTALISALLPQESGVLNLLARCGFDGDLGLAVLVASCSLNTLLGLSILHCPGPWTYAVQIGAVLGYTLTAAFNMPELAIDHCGPLLKNLPLLAMLMLLWLGTPARLSVRAEVSKPRASPSIPQGDPSTSSGRAVVHPSIPQGDPSTSSGRAVVHPSIPQGDPSTSSGRAVVHPSIPQGDPSTSSGRAVVHPSIPQGERIQIT
jgi:uncharacterized protein YbjT (DUF2867 family)